MNPETIADLRANFPEDRGPEFAKGWIAACDRLDALLDALLEIERQSATLALADVAEKDATSLDALRAWVNEQRAKPWAESGSFASHLTGQEGYDAALDELEARLG